jgi:hypothetical protein
MTFIVIIKIEQMKKIISTLLFVVGLVSFSFSQESNQIAESNGADELVASKTSGVYEFTLPSALTKEKIDKSASYYTSFFSLDFDESSHKAKMTMVKNTMKNRYVMAPKAQVVDSLDEFVRVIEQIGEDHDHAAPFHPTGELMHDLSYVRPWFGLDLFHFTRNIGQNPERALGLDIPLQFTIEHAHADRVPLICDQVSQAGYHVLGIFKLGDITRGEGHG